MAVGRLSGAWIHQVVTEVFPAGVVRRVLLNHFAALLVGPRSSKGAKGRLARKMYGRLVSLQRRGLITHEDGVVRSLASPRKVQEAQPTLGIALERLLFRALLAQDGQGDGHTPAALRTARWDFIARALEAGWTLPQAAVPLGIKPQEAQAILDKR